MKVLLISNQHLDEQGVGNPIMFRMRNALAQDERIELVDFMPAYNSISSLRNLRKIARQYDVVHIHFGGLYALFIWIFMMGVKTKKFITFHGTDIHAKALKTAKSSKERLKIRLNQKASFLSIRLFDKCGFVAKEMMDYVPKCLNKQMQEKVFLQPLGVDYTTFVPMDKSFAQEHLGLDHKKYVLFSDVSNTSIKRRDIAESIVEELGLDYNLLIMSAVKPNEVPYYINACDMLLLTSDQEGSPNIIRECLALNKPVFSVDVGDAKEQLMELQKSAIIPRNPQTAASIIHKNMTLYPSDDSRKMKRSVIDLDIVTSKVIDLYFN